MLQIPSLYLPTNYLSITIQLTIQASTSFSSQCSINGKELTLPQTQANFFLNFHHSSIKQEPLHQNYMLGKWIDAKLNAKKSGPFLSPWNEYKVLYPSTHHKRECDGIRKNHKKDTWLSKQYKCRNMWYLYLTIKNIKQTKMMLLAFPKPLKSKRCWKAGQNNLMISVSQSISSVS